MEGSLVDCPTSFRREPRLHGRVRWAIKNFWRALRTHYYWEFPENLQLALFVLSKRMRARRSEENCNFARVVSFETLVKIFDSFDSKSLVGTNGSNLGVQFAPTVGLDPCSLSFTGLWACDSTRTPIGPVWA